MKGLSPTQRTLRALREQGRICAIAEKWIPSAGPLIGGRRIGIRRDLFGFIDVVVLDPQRGIGGIQSTGKAFNEHVNKILDSPVTENAFEWLKTGKCPQCEIPLSFIEVWGWRKVKLRRGAKAMRWAPRVREITLEDFTGRR